MSVSVKSFRVVHSAHTNQHISTQTGRLMVQRIHVVNKADGLTMSESTPLCSGSRGFSSVNCCSLIPAILDSNLQHNHKHRRLRFMYDLTKNRIICICICSQRDSWWWQYCFSDIHNQMANRILCSTEVNWAADKWGTDWKWRRWNQDGDQFHCFTERFIS